MPVTPPPIVSPIVGELPDRGQTETQFDTNQQNFVNYQANFGPEINDLADWIQETADQTEDWANEAEDSADAAALSAAAASASSDFKGAWSSLSGSLSKPATVLHNGAYWMLLNDLANVAASEPGVTADWAFNSGTRWRTPYTASGTLAANSQNTIIATVSPADMTMPVFSQNDFLVLHNSPSSTQLVRMINAAYTIRGNLRTIVAGDNIILRAGDVIHLKAVSPLILEIV